MATQQPIRKKLRRKVASFLSLFIVGLLCLLAIIHSSPWGTQAGITLINKFTDISITYEKGMFSKEIKLSAFAYNNKQVSITAKDLTLKFHLRCLWQQQLCIDTLAIEHLSIKTKSTTTQTKKAQNAEKNKTFELPFSIKAKSVSVHEIEVIMAKYALNFKDFNSPININKSIFTFDEPVIQQLEIASTKKTHLNTSSAHINTPKNRSSIAQQPKIKLPEINLPITLNVINLSLGSLLNQTNLLIGYLPKKSNKLNISVKWVEHDLFIQKFTSDYLIGLADINGKISFTQDYPLNIQFKNQLLNYTSWPELNNSNQIIYLTGDLAHLALTVKSNGAIALDGTGEVDILDSNFPYNINVQATKIPLYNQVSKILHPSKLSLVSSGNIYNQILDANSIVNGLGYTKAKVSLKANYQRVFKDDLQNKLTNNESSQFNHQLIIDEFTLDDINNNLNIVGNVHLKDKPSWDLNIQSTGFTLPELKHKYEHISEHVNPTQSAFGEWLSGRVKGHLNTTGVYNKELSAITLSNTDIEGTINQVPFQLSGKIDLNENLKLSPSVLNLSIYDSTIKLTGFSDTQWNISGSVEIPQINQLNTEINGQLSTLFNITGPLKQPKIHFKNKVKNFSFKKITAPLLNIQGNYTPFNQHLVKAQIKSKSISWLDTNFTNFVGKINADINQQALDIKWDGDFKSKFLLNSHWSESTKHWVGIIAGAEFNYLTHNWKPDTDIIIEYNQNTHKISLNKHCWNNSGLNLCLPQNVSFFEYGKVPLSLSFHSYYFNETFAPTDILINTNIKGNAEISWSPNKNYVVEGDLTVLAGNILLEEKEIYLPVKVLSAWDEGRLHFKVNNEFAKIQLRIGPDEQTKINQQYDFYSNIKLKGDIQFIDNYPLIAEVNIDNFNLRPLQAINHELTLLDGTLSTKTQISGNLNKPKINGELTLTKGRLKLLKSPNVLDDLKIKLLLLGESAELNGTFNIDKDIATINGDAVWKNDKKLNLTINAEKLSILFPPQIEATLSPQLQATLTKDNLKITGKVNVLDGIIRVTKLPEGSVELTNDVIFVDNEGDEIVKEKIFNIESDIQVNINKAFQLTGQGFNGNLAGSLRVQHSSYQPIQLFGNLTIPDGRYHAYGQRLQIERGRVGFNGPLENPHIDLRATRTIPQENIKVGVEIKGLANALSLTLISSPTMSRAQTLSYLLRGQGLDNDTPDNSGIGVALGAALANYSGFLKQIDKLPLINNVEIEGDSSQVSIAGYLGKRIYVKYGIGVDDPINELTIRLFLMSRLWVETISGLENSADIYYSFDTDL